MHCLQGTETLAQQDVVAKNRQRVLDGLTAEIRADTITMALKRIIWGNQVYLIRQSVPVPEIAGFRYGICPIGWIR